MQTPRPSSERKQAGNATPRRMHMHSLKLKQCRSYRVWCRLSACISGQKRSRYSALLRMRRSLYLLRMRKKTMAFLVSWLMEAPGYVERSPLFPNPLVCVRDIAQTAASEVCVCVCGSAHVC